MKFGAIITLFTAIVIAIGVTAMTRRVRSQDIVRSEEVVRATADRIGTAVQGVLEGAFAVVDATADDLVAMRDEGVSDPLVYDTMLKGMIGSGGDRYGAWLVWDGADAPVGDGPSWSGRRDADGRFTTYWHQNGMEMLREGLPAEILASDLYRTPRERQQAFLLEPNVIAAANGDATLVTTFAKPVEHNCRVVGALAVDLKSSTRRPVSKAQRT